MSWPGVADYADELQNPRFCFSDPDLKQNLPRTMFLGIPHLITGNFAGVCQFHGSQGDWAVRCFLREVTDQQEHYQIISEYLQKLNLPEFVTFKYLKKGIKIRGQWYPIVKMAWAVGQTLNLFLAQHLNNPKVIRNLAVQWIQLIAQLRLNRLAHGDLQHGNVLVSTNGRIKLVDYDAMFVPTTIRTKCPELGHPNFQHPLRSGTDYNENLDNFSTLVIYLSLQALAQDPRLWKKFHNSENLILSIEDYKIPSRSELFDKLKKSTNEHVRYLAQTLEECCHGPSNEAPSLGEVLAQAPHGTASATAGILRGRRKSNFSPPPQPLSHSPSQGPRGQFLEILRSGDHKIRWQLAFALGTLLLILGIYLIVNQPQIFRIKANTPPASISPASTRVAPRPGPSITPPVLPRTVLPTTPKVLPEPVKAPILTKPVSPKPPKKKVRLLKPKKEASLDPPLARVEPSVPRRQKPKKSATVPNFKFGIPEVRKIK